MDTDRFDRLVKILSAAASRRGLLRFGAALPLAVALAPLGDEEGEARSRRKGRRKRGRSTVVVCHSGETLSVPRHSVKAVLRDGGTRGACSSPGLGSGAPCLPSTADLQEEVDAADRGATLVLCAGTWNLTNPVEVARNLTLIGAGAGATVLDGGGETRVLEVDDGATVTVQDLTVTNGQTGTNGGGIDNQGVLTLINVTVSNNVAADEGGGIFNCGILSLVGDTSVTGNRATDGGGIYHEDTEMTLFGGVTVSGNTATGSGGGIFNDAGRVTVKDGAFVTGNTARRGGGIENDEGTLELEAGSSVAGNTAQNEGGGILNRLFSTVTLGADDIVTGNTADGVPNNCAPVNTITNCIG